jgi:hypothetical protein
MQFILLLAILGFSWASPVDVKSISCLLSLTASGCINAFSPTSNLNANVYTEGRTLNTLSLSAGGNPVDFFEIPVDFQSHLDKNPKILETDDKLTKLAKIFARNKKLLDRIIYLDGDMATMLVFLSSK